MQRRLRGLVDPELRHRFPGFTLIVSFSLSLYVFASLLCIHEKHIYCYTVIYIYIYVHVCFSCLCDASICKSQVCFWVEKDDDGLKTSLTVVSQKERCPHPASAGPSFRAQNMDVGGVSDKVLA